MQAVRQTGRQPDSQLTDGQLCRQAVGQSDVHSVIQSGSKSASHAGSQFVCQTVSQSTIRPAGWLAGNTSVMQADSQSVGQPISRAVNQFRIDDLRKSSGLHSVSAHRHGLYIQVQACGCSAE